MSHRRAGWLGSARLTAAQVVALLNYSSIGEADTNAEYLNLSTISFIEKRSQLSLSNERCRPAFTSQRQMQKTGQELVWAIRWDEERLADTAFIPDVCPCYKYAEPPIPSSVPCHPLNAFGPLLPCSFVSLPPSSLLFLSPPW